MAIFFILRTRTATPCLEFFISAADIAARPVAIAFGPTTSTSSPSRIGRIGIDHARHEHVALGQKVADRHAVTLRDQFPAFKGRAQQAVPGVDRKALYVAFGIKQLREMAPGEHAFCVDIAAELVQEHPVKRSSFTRRSLSRARLSCERLHPPVGCYAAGIFERDPQVFAAISATLSAPPSRWAITRSYLCRAR